MAASAEARLWVKFEGNVTRITVAAKTVADLDVDSLRTACIDAFEGLEGRKPSSLRVYLNDEATTMALEEDLLLSDLPPNSGQSKRTALVIKVAPGSRKRAHSESDENPRAARRSAPQERIMLMPSSSSYQQLLSHWNGMGVLTRDALDLGSTVFAPLVGAATFVPPEKTTAESELQQIAPELMRQVLANRGCSAIVSVHDTHGGVVFGDVKPDVTLAPAGTPTVALSPFNIVAVIELKSGDRAPDEGAIGQGLKDCLRLLEMNPARRHVFGLVLTCAIVVVVKATRLSLERIELSHGPRLGGAEYAGTIEGFLTADPWGFHGLVPQPMPGSWVLRKPLGLGAAASVFWYEHRDDPRQRIAAKFVFGSAEAERELQVRVSSVVHRTLPPADHENATVCSVASLGGDTPTPQSMLPLSPVGQPLEQGPLSPRHISQLARLLDVIHKEARVLHRDLRAPNVALESDRILLLDFGFALPLLSGTSETAPTRISTALSNESTRVLEHVAARPTEPIALTVADERESFVKLVLVLADPNLDKKVSGLRRAFEHTSRSTWADTLLDIWRSHAAVLRKASLASACAELVPDLIEFSSLLSSGFRVNTT